jgi:hypothetical protein
MLQTECFRVCVISLAAAIYISSPRWVLYAVTLSSLHFTHKVPTLHWPNILS